MLNVKVTNPIAALSKAVSDCCLADVIVIPVIRMIEEDTDGEINRAADLTAGAGYVKEF